MLMFMRESGADRAAARAYGSVRTALRAIGHDRNLVLVFVSGMLGGGGRGLGVLNVFVPLYLSLVLGLDAGTVAIMYTALVVLSVPGPIVAGSLSDRFGRKPLILAAYIGGAAALVGFLLAGDNIPMLWVAILFLGIFNFVESPQLQALLGDLAPPAAARRFFLRVFHIRLRRRVAVDRAIRLGHRHVRRGQGLADHFPAHGRRVPRRRSDGHPDPAQRQAERLVRTAEVMHVLVIARVRIVAA